MPMPQNPGNQVLLRSSDVREQRDATLRSTRRLARLGVMLAALLAFAALGCGLVIGAALLGFAMPARLFDGAAALLMLVLFLGALLSLVGVRRRCPACRKWFSQHLMGETVLDRQEINVNVPRAEAALNSDRMNGYLPTTPVRMHTESYRAHYCCCHCCHEWSEAELRQRQARPHTDGN
jgi:hypothetical protein